jgi:rod shape-determining protein MreC
VALLDIRQRTGYIFLAVIIAHIILISAQVNTARGVPMLEAVTFGVFAEMQRVASSIIESVKGGWEGYFALQRVREENERLRQENSGLQIRLQQERALSSQSRSLQDLLELRQKVEISTTAATVIAAGAQAEFRTVTIDKGSNDGLRPDMAVISPSGVVGRVILPSARAAKVQLLIDRNAAAGGMIARSRAQGVIVGTGTDRLRFEYVSSAADVKVGDEVVTSGIDGIYPAAGGSDGTYPKGFVVGQIESIERGAGTYSSIIVKPSVDFASIEDVLVVLTPSVPAEPAAAKDAGTEKQEPGT